MKRQQKHFYNLMPVRKGFKLQLGDAFEAIELMKKSRSPHLAIPRSPKELIREVRKWYFITNKEGKRIGTVSIHPRTGEIGGFSILPAFRSPVDARSALKTAEKILDLIKDSRITDLRELGLNRRQIKALNYSQGVKGISRKAYEKKFNVSKRTAIRDLNKLLELRMIKEEGKGKSTRYSLN